MIRKITSHCVAAIFGCLAMVYLFTKMPQRTSAPIQMGHLTSLADMGLSTQSIRIEQIKNGFIVGSDLYDIEQESKIYEIGYVLNSDLRVELGDEVDCLVCKPTGTDDAPPTIGVVSELLDWQNGGDPRGYIPPIDHQTTRSDYTVVLMRKRSVPLGDIPNLRQYFHERHK